VSTATDERAPTSLKSRLLVRKPFPSTEGSGLKKVLGALDLTSLGVGAIIGTGIFVITGAAAAKYAGPGIVLSFLFAAIACAFAALAYAEVASMIPASGSAYTYAYTAFGEIIAWVIGWVLILEYVVATSAVAIGWSGYFVKILHNLGLELPAMWVNAPGTAPGALMNLPAILIALAVTMVLIRGIRESTNTNTIFVIVKVAVLIMFIAITMGHINPGNWDPFLPNGFGGVMTGAATIFFAFIGFDAVSNAAEETKNPQRDLPIGILASLGICSAFYIAVGAIFTGIIPQSLYPDLINNAAPLAFALEYIGKGWAAALLSVGAVAGITSVLVVMLMGMPRIFFAMARDGLMPKVFTAVHPRFGTPHLTTILTGVAVAILAGLTPISAVAELANIGTLFAFVLVAIGAWVLRYTRPDWKRGFRTPFIPVVAIGTVLSCGYLMISLPHVTIQRFLIWMAIGVVVYFLYGIKHSHLGKTVR
jgi:APA family basic amino acid/polyamine antiporter